MIALIQLTEYRYKVPLIRLLSELTKNILISKLVFIAGPKNIENGFYEPKLGDLNRGTLLYFICYNDKLAMLSLLAIQLLNHTHSIVL